MVKIFMVRKGKALELLHTLPNSYSHEKISPLALVMLMVATKLPIKTEHRKEPPQNPQQLYFLSEHLNTLPRKEQKHEKKEQEFSQSS